MASAPSTSTASSTMWTYIFQRLTANAYLPTRQSRAAGFDLRSAYTVQIEPGYGAYILTDLRVELATGYIGLISPCSDWMTHSHFDVTTYVLDPTTTSNLSIPVRNRGTRPITIQNGDRIAQIVFVKVLQCINEYL